MDRFDEAYQTVRGEMRYLALYATDHGVIEAIVTRSDDNAKPAAALYSRSEGRKAGATDYRATAFRFHPDDPDNKWQFIASLLYSECEGRDVPVHGDLKDEWIDKLRADSDRVVTRANSVAPVLAARRSRSGRP